MRDKGVYAFPLWNVELQPCQLGNGTAVSLSKVKIVTVVKGDPKAPFSIATTPMCMGERNSFPWIASVYPWSVPYNAEC